MFDFFITPKRRNSTKNGGQVLKVITLICYLLTLALAVFPVYADDKYEENDNAQTAYNFSTSERIWLHFIDGLGIHEDPDFYEISVCTDCNRLKVDLRFSHADDNLDLIIYDSSLNIVTYTNSTTDDELIDHIIPGGGTYYVLVHGSSSSAIYDLWWDDYPIVSTPYPADGSTVKPGNASQLLQVYAPWVSGGTFYYDDDSVFLNYQKIAFKQGDYLQVYIPYETGKMNNNGSNYWYVEVTDSFTHDTLRYPVSGNWSFTVKDSPVMPWLMMLLKN